MSHRDCRLPIGVFDSGVGGLTVARQLHRLMPGEDIVYLGDTARVPYGTKSAETVIRFAREDASFLQSQRVKAIVVACNTASALALKTLLAELTLPVFGVIEPGAAAAALHTRNGRIGVIATSSTIRSRAYEHAIHRHRPDTQVHTAPCPLLVPLVEEGWLQHSVTNAVLVEYLTPLLSWEIDTLVLGCTHYPLLKRAIRQVAGPEVRLIDSAESCAVHVLTQLDELNLLKRTHRRGVISPFVTDEPARFESLARRFLRTPARKPRHIELG